MPPKYPDQQHEESLRADGDVGWKLYCTASFTTAMAVVMAELTRQVEIQCSERAHALALAWNLYSAAMDTCLGQHGSQAKSPHYTEGLSGVTAPILWTHAHLYCHCPADCTPPASCCIAPSCAFQSHNSFSCCMPAHIGFRQELQDPALVEPLGFLVLVFVSTSLRTGGHCLAFADEKHRNSSERTTCIAAGRLQAELHQLSGHNIALAAENMQMKHEMEQTVSLQKELALSKQVLLTPAAVTLGHPRSD